MEFEKARQKPEAQKRKESLQKEIKKQKIKVQNLYLIEN